MIQNAWRRGGNAVDRAENVLTSDRTYRQPQLRGVLKILWIVVDGGERSLESLRPLGGHAGWSSERPRDPVGEFGNFDQGTCVVVGRKLARSRHIGKLRVACCARELDKRAHCAARRKPVGLERAHG